MVRNIDTNHPLYEYFRDLAHEALAQRIGLQDSGPIELYISEMLMAFIHDEAIFSLRDPLGKRILSIPEMMAEADILQNAKSFQREREVHQHIGDFLLFWSGLFPEMLQTLDGFVTSDLTTEAAYIGSASYEVVSEFDHAPYEGVAPLFRRLSEEFLECQYGLTLIRASFDGFKRQGWNDGFTA